MRAAGAGWRVALVEGDLLGGACPNRGCVPSKLLLGFAEVATTIRHAARFHIFSYPEVAGVGLTEDELEADGTAYLVGSVPYTNAAKGRAVKERHGLCKFLVSPDGAILDCHIIGHHASVLLHEVIPVMLWRNKIDSLTDMIHIHPSLSEVVRNAARVAQKACQDA